MKIKRVIYSIYVDVPVKEHYGQSQFILDSKEKASITVNAFKEHYKRLIESKRKYAKSIGVPFIMYEYDTQYQTFEKSFLKDFPELTGYEIVNFYKIHLLYELAKNYDEILFLDFDAIPVTKDSFFDAWDLSKGICVYNNNAMVNKKMKPINEIIIDEIFPGKSIKTDEDILNHCKKSIKTNWHPVGTCKMGTEEDIYAVCDTKLRVKGVKGLRIFDASSFPNIVAGNTNAPVIAFALKAVTELINEY